MVHFSSACIIPSPMIDSQVRGFIAIGEQITKNNPIPITSEFFPGLRPGRHLQPEGLAAPVRTGSTDLRGSQAVPRRPCEPAIVHVLSLQRIMAHVVASA